MCNHWPVQRNFTFGNVVMWNFTLCWPYLNNITWSTAAGLTEWETAGFLWSAMLSDCQIAQVDGLFCASRDTMSQEVSASKTGPDILSIFNRSKEDYANSFSFQRYGHETNVFWTYSQHASWHWMQAVVSNAEAQLSRQLFSINCWHWTQNLKSYCNHPYRGWKLKFCFELWARWLPYLAKWTQMWWINSDCFNVYGFNMMLDL